jgi:hypothetical protein
MPLTLKAMKYFTSALRHGSIVKAAAELNIAAYYLSCLDVLHVSLGVKDH